MKQQILSRILSLCLCLTLIPTDIACAAQTDDSLRAAVIPAADTISAAVNTLWTPSIPFRTEAIPDDAPDIPVMTLSASDESESAPVMTLAAPDEPSPDDETALAVPDESESAPVMTLAVPDEPSPDDNPALAVPDEPSTDDETALATPEKSETDVSESVADAFPVDAADIPVSDALAIPDQPETFHTATDRHGAGYGLTAAPEEWAALFDDVDVTGVRLNQDAMTVNVGESASLTATVVPSNATNRTVIWTSSNASIATVDSSGRVSGVSAGTAYVTAQAGGFSAQCAITVIIPVTNVTLSKETATVTLGAQETLTATVLPANATNKTVTWSSSNTRAVTVSANGTVTAAASGQAVITASAGGRTAQCVVTVYVPPTGLTINKSELTLGVGRTDAITATVSPSDASNKTVTWKSSDEKVAIVDTNGQISALKEGNAVISAQIGTYTANCILRVVILPTSITLSKDELSILVGESEALTATVLPATTTDKTVTWTSSSTSVATVSNTGRVTAVNGGRATITARAGEQTATCNVTVVVRSTGITLNQTAITLNVGATQNLTASVSPSNATDKTVTWTTSDEKVALVNSNGAVTAVGEGMAIIRASNGSNNVNCVVTVVIPPASVTLNEDAISVILGRTATLTATVLPANATNKTVTWTSSTTNAVTVDSKGVVTAVGSGRSTITATAGTVSARCTVTVIVLPDEITLNKEETTISVGAGETLTATVLPNTTSDKTITWTSSDEKVATVDRNGRVTGVTEGKTVITAAVGEQATGIKRATCEVNIVIPPASVTLDQTNLTLAVGGVGALRATVLPENTSASVKTVTWTSGNTTVATVDAAGRVTGLSKGTAVITAMAGNQSARCTVNVVVPVTGLTLSRDEMTLNIGRDSTLRAVIEPADANTQTATWTSSNPDVVTVDAAGRVAAMGEGTAVITATAEEHAASCTVTVVIPAGSVLVTPARVTLNVGAFEELSVAVEPENTTDKTVIWTSSNPEIATVDPDGVISALSGGNATITASVGGQTSTCAVTVVVPVAELSLNVDTLTLDVGAYEVLRATVGPETATDKTLTWTSSNEDIASVNQVGRVTALKEGVSVITVAAGEKIAECSVRVVIPAESIRLDRVSLSLVAGQSALLEAIIEPDNVTDKTVTWTSSNAAVATVDEEGRVSAVGGGAAIIAASIGAQRTSCEVIVSVPVGAVRLSRDELSLDVDNSATLRATVEPADATNKTVTWSSSNEEVAEVDANGLVTAIAEGTAVVTALAGDKTANCTVTVVIPVSGIRLDPAEAALDVGESAILRATIEPADATSKTVTWSSSNSQAAIVDSNGRVTAMGEGSAVITARAGTQSARCVVTVSIPVTSILLNRQELALEVGRSATLEAVVGPEEASDKSVTWSSSDTRIAVVDRNGKVSATGGGAAIITARAGKLSADCTVTVIVPVSGVTLSQDALSLETGTSSVLRAVISPDNATDKSVTWSSSDPKTATVDETGRVTGVGGGSAFITAQAGNQIARCLVTVTVPVTTVRLNRSALTLALGASDTLTATVEPAAASDKTVTWTSSNTAVATVDRSGRVTAAGGGTAIITARSGNRSADCTVTVSVPVTGVTLSQDRLSLLLRDTALLEATILPDNATIRNVTWSSNDSTVVTVDSGGRVSAVGGGSAVITASAGGRSARCTVEVTVPVTGVTLSREEMSLSLGRSEVLEATVSPENATDQTVTWTSSNPDVAAVDRNGRVTAAGRGSAVITARAGDETADCTVTVSVAVTGIRLNQTYLSMLIHAGAALNATVSPSDATDKTVTWTSSDEKIVTVDQTGRVSAVGGGSAVIIAQAGDYAVRCTVNVTVPVTEVTINKSELRLSAGASEILTAAVSPSDATDKTITWTSSNTQVAAVDRNGRVTAAGGGTAIITARSGEQYADCTVTVTVPVSTVRLDRTRLSLTAGGSEVLTATISPADATDKTVTWSSSNPQAATVDENGRVTGVGGGSTTVTARAGSQTASCIVTVSVTVTSVRLNRDELTLAQGSNARLTATVEPENVSDKTVTWTSSNESVAVVDKNGKVTGANGGTAIITASAGGQSADCTVIVTVPASRVLLDRAALSLNAGAAYQLSAVIEPANVTDKTVTWTSSNPEVVVVNENGRVTGISGGTASITAAVGGRSAQCRVTVSVPVTALGLTKTELLLGVGSSETLQPIITPSGATDRAITWTSNNTAVAVVDKNGRVTAAAEGNATITAAIGTHTAACRVTVSPRSVAVTSVFLNAASLSLTEGDARTLTVTIMPSNATDRAVTWSSSNPAAASVDETGRVRAISAGVATVTAQVGSRMATCRVTVRAQTALPDAQIQSAVRNGAAVTAVISTTRNATAYCVSYSQGGRMLDMKAQPITPSGTDYTFIMNSANYSYANVVVLDELYHPLCEGRRAG